MYGILDSTGQEIGERGPYAVIQPIFDEMRNTGRDVYLVWWVTSEHYCVIRH